MINIFEFIYYCLYRMYALFKRVNAKNENLASFIYSLMLSINAITLLFPLRFFFPKGYFTAIPYSFLLKLFLALIFFILYLFCKNYFLKRQNYIRIINVFEKKFEHKNQQMAFIGFFYWLFTVISFISLAIWLSRM
jgi:hypothetical protein